MGDNIGAIKLYKKLEFVEEGKTIKDVKSNDEYQNLLLMALFV